MTRAVRFRLALIAGALHTLAGLLAIGRGETTPGWTLVALGLVVVAVAAHGIRTTPSTETRSGPAGDR